MGLTDRQARATLSIRIDRSLEHFSSLPLPSATQGIDTHLC